MHPESHGPSIGGSPGGNGATNVLFRRGSVYTITLAIQLSAGVLVVPALTRLLSPKDYGSLTLVLMVIQVLVVLASAGIPSSITRFFFAESGGSVRARSLIPLTFAVALIVALVADITGPMWSRVFSEVSYDQALRVATWSIVPFATTLACQAALRAQDRVGAFVVVGGIAAVGAQALGLGAIWIVQPTPTAYLIGFATGVLVASAVGVVLTRPPVPREPSRLLRSALRYGLPTVPHSLALFLMAAGDRVVVERILGLEAVARYQVAYIVGGVAIALLAAFNNAWAPLIYGTPDEKRWSVLADTSHAVYRIACLFAGLLAASAPLGLWIVAPEEFSRLELVPVTALVALSVVPYVAYLAAAHIVFYHGKTVVVAWLTPLVASLNLALNFLLVPPLGIVGAAVATFASYLILAAGLHTQARKLEQVDWHISDMALFTTIAVALVAVGAIVPVSAWGAWVRITVSGVLLVAIFRELTRHRPEA